MSAPETIPAMQFDVAGEPPTQAQIDAHADRYIDGALVAAERARFYRNFRLLFLFAMFAIAVAVVLVVHRSPATLTNWLIASPCLLLAAFSWYRLTYLVRAWQARSTLLFDSAHTLGTVLYESSLVKVLWRHPTLARYRELVADQGRFLVHAEVAHMHAWDIASGRPGHTPARAASPTD